MAQKKATAKKAAEKKTEKKPVKKVAKAPEKKPAKKVKMNAYVQRVIENVRKKYAAEPEFVQTVEEVFSSLAPVIDANPAYEKADILSRMAEPERMFTFRVCWTDDKGEVHTNVGYRCQFNGAIGPYKGGLRFQPNVYPGIIKFLGFEQTYKNALTGLPSAAARAALTSIPPASPTRRSCASARAL